MKFWTKVFVLLGSLFALVISFDGYMIATGQPKNGLYVVPVALLVILGVCVAWKLHEDRDLRRRLDESDAYALKRLKALGKPMA